MTKCPYSTREHCNKHVFTTLKSYIVLYSTQFKPIVFFDSEDKKNDIVPILNLIKILTLIVDKVVALVIIHN